MAYERVKDLSTDVVHKLGGGMNEKTKKANPSKIEGFYLGNRTVQTTNGDAKIHVFQTPKGNEGVWGSKELNDKLGQVGEGTMTLVEYTGKKKLQGGKTLHTYSVSQDKSNRVKVAVDAAEGSAYEEPTEEYSSDDSSEVSDEDVQQAAALLAAERAAKTAKVQEILNRGKGKKA